MDGTAKEKDMFEADITEGITFEVEALEEIITADELWIFDFTEEVGVSVDGSCDFAKAHADELESGGESGFFVDDTDPDALAISAQVFGDDGGDAAGFEQAEGFAVDVLHRLGIGLIGLALFMHAEETDVFRRAEFVAVDDGGDGGLVSAFAERTERGGGGLSVDFVGVRWAGDHHVEARSGKPGLAGVAQNHVNVGFPIVSNFAFGEGQDGRDDGFGELEFDFDQGTGEPEHGGNDAGSPSASEEIEDAVAWEQDAEVVFEELEYPQPSDQDPAKSRFDEVTTLCASK